MTSNPDFKVTVMFNVNDLSSGAVSNDLQWFRIKVTELLKMPSTYCVRSWGAICWR